MPVIELDDKELKNLIAHTEVLKDTVSKMENEFNNLESKLKLEKVEDVLDHLGK